MRYGINPDNFFRGFGRALDMRGSLEARYAHRTRPPASDQTSIASDWSAVWSDLGEACDRVTAGDPRGLQRGWMRRGTHASGYDEASIQQG